MQDHPLQRRPVKTHRREEIVDLTPLVRRAVAEAKLHTGMVILFVPHTTAAVTINENYDADVKRDLLAKLAELVPKREAYYQHAEGNSDSHLKTAAVGNSATVLVEAGEMMLGRWQGVYFCEFDGPRDREVWIKLVSFQ